MSLTSVGRRNLIIRPVHSGARGGEDFKSSHATPGTRDGPKCNHAVAKHAHKQKTYVYFLCLFP